MRRPQVLVAIALALSAGPALAEPLDLDLRALGSPNVAAWEAAPYSLSPAVAAQRVIESKTRFALLTSDLVLAFTTAVLEPASTTGHSGFDVEAEGAYAQVHTDQVGSSNYWPTHSLLPHELFVPSIHVRKSLPWSVELGGRFMYLSQSSYFAAQLEGKVAVSEGFAQLPDVAVRVAFTQVFGPRDLNLAAYEADLMVSKRFGVNAVVSLTPYGAARFTFASAGSKEMSWAPVNSTPSTVLAATAAFPTVHSIFYRTTAGVRLTSYAVSLGVEGTYYGGGKFKATDDYPGGYSVKSGLGGAARFGFEF